MNPWLARVVGGSLLIGAVTLSAQTVPPAVSAAPAGATAQSAPTIAATPVSRWDVSTTLRGSVGYRENVTVSAFTSIDRAFWRTEAELFVIRPLGTQWQFVSFLSADVLRYIDPPPSVPGEQQWVGDIEARWSTAKWLRLTLKGVGFTQSTFIDPSETEGSQLAPIWVRIRGGYATLTPRVNLPWGFTFEPSIQRKDIRYRGYGGDHRETRSGMQLEWKRTDLLVLSAAWYEHARNYSELAELSLGNHPIAGTHLSLHQREGQLKISSRFSAQGNWAVAALVGKLQSRDRARGFLDYDQRRAELDVNWSRGSWRIITSGEARRLNYLNQLVGTGTSRPRRLADIFELVGRVEHDLTPKWAGFVENRWERNRSNVIDQNIPLLSYRTNTALLGVERNF